MNRSETPKKTFMTRIRDLLFNDALEGTRLTLFGGSLYDNIRYLRSINRDQ